MLLLLLSDPAGVGGWMHPGRLIGNQEYKEHCQTLAYLFRNADHNSQAQPKMKLDVQVDL